MKKKIIGIIGILIIVLSCSTGCFKRDKMEDINIITTIYPVEYVANRLYGDNSNVSSIYPKGININTYKLTNKKIKDYSEKDLFIYNGKSNEREYATSMLTSNKDLKIIDASYGIEINYKTSDIWLNPANMLMIAQNIRNELKEYISNSYVINEITNQYDLLKVDITELETEIKKAADNSNYKTIVVIDESLNFLEKYGFKVINITEEGKIKQSNVDLANNLYANKKINYIFTIENNKPSDEITQIINDFNAKELTIKSLENLTEKDVKNNDDYLSLMHYNLELIKKETYK